MTRVRTVEEYWQDYRALCVPAHAVHEQLYQLRLAFYAGAQLMLDMTMFLASLDEAHAVVLLEGFHGEMRAFRETLKGD